MGTVLALTGVTGKSGSALAKRIGKNYSLIERMFPSGIRAIVRVGANTDNLRKAIPAVDILPIGLDDVTELGKAFQDVDTVVHVANIHYSPNVVEAAVVSKVRRLILVHTTGIYSKFKAAGEEYRKIDAYVYRECEKHHIFLTILRPTMIYGNCADRNISRFIQMVDRLPIMPVVNHAAYKLQPVHYDDLGEAYYQVLLHEATTANRDFNLSGEAPVLLKDIFCAIGECLGKEIRFLNVPFWLAYLGAWGIFLCSLMHMDFREKVQRLCESRVFSHDDAVRAFGYCPRSFYDGLVDEVREYLSNRRRIS